MAGSTNSSGSTNWAAYAAHTIWLDKINNYGGDMGSAGTPTLKRRVPLSTNIAPRIHGNSLKSMRPTWGYKLYQNDGTFLKNGIISQAKAESRYTKTFMSDKYMEKQLFPNRRAAYDWEAAQNRVQKGPLNKNNH